MADLKVELAIALLGLIQVLTAVLSRRQHKSVERTLEPIVRSLRPPEHESSVGGPTVLFDPDATPQNTTCLDRKGHHWRLAEHEIVWRCSKCGKTFTDA